MKRILTFITMCIVFLSSSVSAQTEYTKKEKEMYAKEAEKEAKAAVKKLEKEKWTFNGIGTFQGAYLRYLLQTEPFGGVGTPKSHELNNVPNLAAAEKSLLNLAQSSYAQENEAYLQAEQNAHTGEHHTVLDDNTVKSLGQFNGDVKQSFMIYKKTRDGRYDVRGYFIIDSDKTRAKLRKLAEELASEVEMSEKIKKKVTGEE